MKRNSWLMIFVLMFVFVGAFVFFVGKGVMSVISMGGGESAKIASNNSIMHLRLQGVIIDGEKFLKALKKYRKEDDIKAFVIEINSPGGVVGPSQEIYAEIKRTREEFKKPVVAVSPGLVASGAYYSAVAADKLIVAPGAMVGSIGVIMEFANLEHLYEWAKVSRYTITTGKYKDSGAEYRSMRDDERQLFQDMINEVWVQFKEAVADGRKMKMEDVEPYADGRVMTGVRAVKLGFADEVGTVDHAFEVAAVLAKLKKFEIFELPKKHPGLMELLTGADEDAEADSRSFLGNKLSSAMPNAGQISSQILNDVLKADLLNKPLFILPGFWK